MRVHTYERAFLAVGGALLVIFMGILGYTSLAMGVHLPGHEGHIDPLTARTTPPFDQPGLRQTAPGEYQVVLLASAWQFAPAEIRVPRGARVTFVGTSTDVVHGFHVAKTRINVMLIPGQISRVQYTFDQPGEYLIVCHEYCGAAHHIMSGKVIVE
jgi:cytochrome c oxidase subunit 2